MTKLVIVDVIVGGNIIALHEVIEERMTLSEIGDIIFVIGDNVFKTVKYQIVGESIMVMHEISDLRSAGFFR